MVTFLFWSQLFYIYSSETLSVIWFITCDKIYNIATIILQNNTKLIKIDLSKEKL